jgi:hypothetical protein
MSVVSGYNDLRASACLGESPLPPGSFFNITRQLYLTIKMWNIDMRTWASAVVIWNNFTVVNTDLNHLKAYSQACLFIPPCFTDVEITEGIELPIDKFNRVVRGMSLHNRAARVVTVLAGKVWLPSLFDYHSALTNVELNEHRSDRMLILHLLTYFKETYTLDFELLVAAVFFCCDKNLLKAGRTLQLSHRSYIFVEVLPYLVYIRTILTIVYDFRVTFRNEMTDIIRLRKQLLSKRIRSDVPLQMCQILSVPALKTFRHTKKLRKLGEGAYGKIYLIEHKGVSFARKIQSRWEESVLEIGIMRSLNHPNVESVVEFGFTDMDKTYITMPAEAKDLLADLPNTSTNQSYRLRLQRDLLTGLAYLHSYGIIHCDLKPQNILISPTGVAKIADFGLAITNNYQLSHRLPQRRQEVVTEWWRDVRLLRGEQKGIVVAYGAEIDVWAMGIIFIEMILGKMLVPTYNNNDNISILEVMEKMIVGGEIFYIPQMIINVSRPVIQSMLVVDPDRRATAASALAKL